MAAPRILVTGASGFLGRQALPALISRGFEVHAVARSRPSGADPAVSWHAADLLDTEAAPSLLDSLRPSHLLHFAWYAEHGKFWDNSLNLDWLSATLNLAKAFAGAGGKRFIGAGTCAEYDWSSGLCDEEATSLRPATLYGASKAAAFLALQGYFREAGVAFAWGRIFHLFGPGEAENRLVPSLIRAHLSGRPLDCGPAEHARDFLSTAAAGDAFAHLCAAVLTGPVNIGSGEETPLGALSDRIASLAGKKADIRFGARSDAGPARLVPSVQRLRESGWKPSHSLEAGLREALDWWRKSP